jgi:hypothetical protein
MRRAPVCTIEDTALIRHQIIWAVQFRETQALGFQIPRHVDYHDAAISLQQQNRFQH